MTCATSAGVRAPQGLAETCREGRRLKSFADAKAAAGDSLGWGAGPSVRGWGVWGGPADRRTVREGRGSPVRGMTGRKRAERKG